METRLLSPSTVSRRPTNVSCVSIKASCIFYFTYPLVKTIGNEIIVRKIRGPGLKVGKNCSPVVERGGYVFFFSCI